MRLRSAACLFAATVTLGLGALGATVIGVGLGALCATNAAAFARIGSPGASGMVTVEHGASLYRGVHFTSLHGPVTALPQQRCIPRQMHKLFALDPNADPDFVAATAAHLCGVRNAG
jgi:hypothetical protein